MPKPHFIVIGAEKSGTTWLSKIINQNPDIYIPPEKEVHFFDLDKKYNRGAEWYESRFDNPLLNTINGDITPEYLIKSDIVSKRIKGLYPDVKIIAILRNPVERAISNYHMNTIYGRIDKEINEVVVPGSNIVEKGRYKKLLKPFFDDFKEDQILILSNDELKKDGYTIIRAIENFLGMEPFEGYKGVNNTIFKARYVRSLFIVKIFKFCIKTLSQIGFKTFFENHKHGLRRFMKKYNSVSRDGMKLSPANKQVLIEYYSEDIAYLEDLWNCSLDHWKV